MAKYFLLYLMLVLQSTALAQSKTPLSTIYHFHAETTYTRADGKPKKTTAYLWIPPQCPRVRGVLVLSQNVLEQWLAEHSAIRQACAASDLAIFWSCPTLFSETKRREKDREIHRAVQQQLLDTLASVSGYDEIQRVPWLVVGHSGTNNMVNDFLIHTPNRLIAAIAMKIGPPDRPIFTDVPTLYTAGEYMEWGQFKQDLLNPLDSIQNYRVFQRVRTAKTTPMTYFFDPNTGHFDCSEKLTLMIADYIKAVCKVRLSPENDTILRPIDMEKGWIVGLPLPNEKAFLPKPFKKATADERKYPWFLDEKSAKMAYDLANINWKRKMQYATFSTADGQVAPFSNRYQIVWPIPYETQNDGVTFNLQTTFLEKLPDSFRFAGSTIGHGEATPQVIPLCGSVAQVDKNTFQLTPERTFPSCATYFIIRQEGDKTYRTALSPGQLVLSKNTEGVAQSIDFQAINNTHLKSKSLVLNAKSSSGMTTHFYVKSGAAYILGDTLFFTQIPPRTKMPMKITVVAYQWGRSQEPKVQMAATIERFFWITNN